MPNTGTLNLPLAGGNTLTIGEAVVGGTPTEFLYIDGTGKLASSSQLYYDGTYVRVGDMSSITDDAWNIHQNGEAIFSNGDVRIAINGETDYVFFVTGITYLDGGEIQTSGNGAGDLTLNGILTAAQSVVVGPTLALVGDVAGSSNVEIGSTYWEIKGDGSLSFDGGSISSNGSGFLYCNVAAPSELFSDGGNFTSDGSGGVRMSTLYMGGYIQDVGLIECIDPNGRLLYNTGGTILCDWSGAFLYAPNGLGVDSGMTVSSGALTISGGTTLQLVVGNNASIGGTLVVSSDANVSGNINSSVVGRGLTVKGGTNARIGTLTLNGTTAVVVANTSVTANSQIFLTINTAGGTVGAPYSNTRVNGTSFSVKSTAVGDTSTCSYFIVEKT